MIETSAIFYFSIVMTAMVLSGLGWWFTAAMPGIDRRSKRYFQGYFAALLTSCLFCLLELILTAYHFPGRFIYNLVVLECLLLSLPLLVLSVYLVYTCQEDMRTSRLLQALMGLEAVYLALIISALFTDVFAYVGQDDRIYRGPLYFLLLLPLIIMLLVDFAGVIRRRARLSHRVFLGYHVAILPMAAALIVQMFIDVLPIIDVCYVLSALIMYSFVLSDQIEQDLRQQREIASQRSSIMVLQMRPHFIYNTMTSIYCLCDQNPKLARQVILDFTTYLRKNFTAIASENPIPFTSELEHTRAYLAVEKAQYEDSLLVDFDTPHTFFRVPPLTLQPIVENAVKHGRDPYAGPLHITIRTRKTDSGNEITVADDGRGFQPSDQNEGHIALNNIRQRLELMCGGDLKITSNDGRGTVVTITIPENSGR